ncbi:hypothetical protein LBMAG42_14180 [Deltaproteobacteria bacterium]|nr:hypothetical protein LBMAG42_14180 [Deltaproteobacteria bacterium]
MAGRAELEVDGSVTLVDIAELEEDVRRARVLGNARLHHPPWTGDRWCRIDEIPALADALESSDARLAAHLSAPTRLFLAPALVLTLLGAGFVQFSCRAALAADGGAALQALSLGWESTLLDGAWWTPFSSQLLHESFFHLIGNLVIVAYCAWRCERALGALGLVGVMGGALLGGTLAVTTFSALPCIGASVLAFGLWGGQFAIGWRFGAVIPAPLRGYYGAGTVLVALPLLAWSLTNPHASFVGHAGGWIGGAAVALLMPVATTSARGGRNHALIKSAVTAALLLVSPAAFAVLAGWAPPLLMMPGIEIVDADSQLAVTLPWRFAAQAGVATRAPEAPLDVLLDAPNRHGALHLARTPHDAHPDAHRDFAHTAIATHDRWSLVVSWGDDLPRGRRAVYEAIAASARWSPPAVRHKAKAAP